MTGPTTTRDISASAAKRRTPLHLAATYAGKAWQVGLALLCMPVYLRQLGPEGFGIIGLFLVFQRVATLFDSGFSRAINRELAQSICPKQAGEALRTLEIVYISICLGLFLLAATGRGVLAPHLATDHAPTLVLLMAATIAFQLPNNYYTAALAGLERHLTLSVIHAVWQSLRYLGGSVVLLYSPTLLSFFVWQMMVTVACTSATAVCAWNLDSLGFLTSRFRLSRLRSLFGYATSATLCTVTAVVMTQIDKLILYRQLNATDYGYYVMSWSMVAMLFVAVSPIGAILFPKLARRFRLNELEELSVAYRWGCQLVAIVVVPLAATGATCTNEVIFAWLGDQKVAGECGHFTRLMFVGVGLNCLGLMPHNLQLAAGWTSLVNRINVASILIFSPAFYVAGLRHGADGAATVWVLFGALHLAAQVILMHQRLLPAELKHWLKTHTGVIVLSTCAAFAISVIAPHESRIACGFTLMSVWLGALIAAVFACPLPRRWLTGNFARLRKVSAPSVRFRTP